MDRYVVIGNPVSHSKSPFIHRCFAEQTGQQLDYGTLQVETGAFAQAATRFFAEGGCGANVTVPFKQDAYDLAIEKTPEAEKAGAVNTLYLNAAREICGHNTDGIGLVRDILDNHGGVIKGKHVLVLGAGGATRGILQPLLREQPASLYIANRTGGKAAGLARTFADLASENASDLDGGGFEQLPALHYDWIINATSASLQGKVPAISGRVVFSTTWCYDLMYSDKVTPFCRWGMDMGASRVMDGLGMLVEQAAAAFELWRGIRPQTAPVLERLRQR